MNMCDNKLLDEVVKKNISFVVVTGGVCSSIGKGILVSSIGVLLRQAGYSLSLVKWDPYLNVDPGTMSPLVHGEVFVTNDGGETDLDLGHYERLVGIELDKSSSVSSGQIFEEVLRKERAGDYLGKCIQLVPHVVDETKRRLLKFALNKDVQFVLLEIGGTVGDMEGNVFLEAIRQLRMDLGSQRFMHAHLSFVPVLEWTGEVKTKPTQHSVIQLKQAGLVPDCLFLRSDGKIDKASIDKLSIMCGVQKDYIFHVPTARPVYNLFLDLNRQLLGQRIQEYFSLPVRESDLTEWAHLIDMIASVKGEVNIGLIAKYVGTNDPYISVIEALRVAGYHCGVSVKIDVIDAERAEREPDYLMKGLKSAQGIVVPGGFDTRGIIGKIAAARYAREKKVPFLGLCLGMQIMLIEFARSVLGVAGADSTEIDKSTAYPVISLLEEQADVTTKGATMRLGGFPCKLLAGSKAYEAYQKDIVIERHRHRYEFNNEYKEMYEKAGIVFSGLYEKGNLVEIAEIKDHPFMVGSQFHPEFTSAPLKVHPLFRLFIESIVNKKL